MVRRSSARRWLWWVTGSVITIVAILLAASWYVNSSTQTQMYTVASAPYRKVALVLGTSRRTRNRKLNQYYTERMRTAAELYGAGKVQYLLVSGDNGTVEYNEPDSMRRDLVAMGVPAERIALDFAGFDTFDSMIRANKVWGVDSVLVVSQDFQARRAVYVANHRNIVAGGVAARDPNESPFALAQLREVFARLKLLADVHVLFSQPRYLGAREYFPADTVK